MLSVCACLLPHGNLLETLEKSQVTFEQNNAIILLLPMYGSEAADGSYVTTHNQVKSNDLARGESTSWSC